MLTFKMKTGDLVTAKAHEGETYPITYANRTQARNAALRIEGAEVIQRGRPFYVRLIEKSEKPTGVA